MALVVGDVIKFNEHLGNHNWFGPRTEWKVGIVTQVQHGHLHKMEVYSDQTGRMAGRETGWIHSDYLTQITLADLDLYLAQARHNLQRAEAQGQDRGHEGRLREILINPMWEIPLAPQAEVDNRLTHEIFVVLYGDRAFPNRYVGQTEANAARRVVELRRQGHPIIAQKKLTIRY